MAEPLRVGLIGAGNRGMRVYGRFILQCPEDARLVAVADPDQARRELAGETHGIPPEHQYSHWRDLLAADMELDALILATPDRLHTEPALAALERGCDVLLEKPIAPTREEVLRVARAARDAPGSITVAHPLRYTHFFSAGKMVLDEGRLGELVAIQHTENIGYWHFAHSYVRGNWRRADMSSPMILAKSCHDLDVLRWFAGAPCRRVASFGRLAHFRRDKAPAPDVPERCLDGCPVEDSCPFHAGRFYLQNLRDHADWPVATISADPSPEARRRALEEGPYGRCVYRTDNDVVDHQVTSLEFANGVAANFTLSGFTEENTRTLKLMGTRGELRGHLEQGEIEVRPFADPGPPHRAESPQLPHRRLATVVSRPAPEIIRVPTGGGHAGGDEGLMATFLQRAAARRDGHARGGALTSLDESLDSHLMAFAAEEARLAGRVVEMEGEAATP